jgi:NAD(P)H-hydrate epimerase
MASLECLLKQQPVRLVLDADALNMLSEKPSLLDLLPEGSILTPHPGEFDRLAGTSFKTGYGRLEAAIRFAVSHHIFLVLKGAYTACINPEGICHFNNSGNPGMSTGGSGDVLTGIIVSLLAQGYTQQEACLLGTFLHGLSADLALDRQSQESLTAGDIADHLGSAFKALR